MANHSNITYSSVGVQQIANAMAAIGMQRIVQPGVAVTIEGPSAFYSGSVTYTAAGSGGDGNYEYRWYYRWEGTEMWEYLATGPEATIIVGSSSPGFTLQVTAYSAGLNGTASVTVVNGNVCCVQ